MFCRSCSRRTLGFFIETITDIRPLPASRTSAFRNVQASSFSSVARRLQDGTKDVASKPKPVKSQSAAKDILAAKSAKTSTKPTETKAQAEKTEKKEKEPWQLQKEAIKKKLGGETWNPRKKLSPDTMEGIRHLHQTQPDKFTTPVLAQHFKVSPEAIRRILKSKWRPSEEEDEDRRRRWDKRGEKIWSNLVEMGIKPPKKWREMGVGRTPKGEKPRWKQARRNQVPVNDGGKNEGWKEYEEMGGFDGDIIPIVDGQTGEPISRGSKSAGQDGSIFRRLG